SLPRRAGEFGELEGFQARAGAADEEHRTSLPAAFIDIVDRAPILIERVDFRTDRIEGGLELERRGIVLDVVARSRLLGKGGGTRQEARGKREDETTFHECLPDRPVPSAR